MPEEQVQTQQQEQQPEQQQPKQDAQPSFPTNLSQEQLAQMYSFYEEQNRNTQLNQLKEAWGDEFDDTHAAVADYLGKLPEDQQGQFNNVQGAMLIAKALRYDAMTNPTTQVPNAEVPQVDGSTTVPTLGKPKYKFTRSQIRSMPEKEVIEKQAEINDAYAKGLVHNDL